MSPEFALPVEITIARRGRKFVIIPHGEGRLRQMDTVYRIENVKIYSGTRIHFSTGVGGLIQNIRVESEIGRLKVLESEFEGVKSVDIVGTSDNFELVD